MVNKGCKMFTEIWGTSFIVLVVGNRQHIPQCSNDMNKDTVFGTNITCSFRSVFRIPEIVFLKHIAEAEILEGF
jgi:hypothetical protein